MKKERQWVLRLRDRRGVTAIFVAIIIVMLLGFAALAVDIGHVMVTRNELQNISDASALAAARQLGAIYEPMSYLEQQTYVCDPATMILVAQDVASKNQAAGMNITVNTADVIVGKWDANGNILTPTLNQPDAVRVIARRDGVANGPLTTFFARILGINTVNVSAKATAALTGQSVATARGLPLPIGISKYFFERGEFCNQNIKFYPSNDPAACGGWHTYDMSPSTPAKLKAILDGIENGTFISPETKAFEDRFNFTGGNLTTVFSDLKELFDAMKGRNDGTLDDDDDPNTWTTTVVVYDYSELPSGNECSNPGQGVNPLIVGFSTVTITNVEVTPEKTIVGKVKCYQTVPGRGSGGDYGNRGSIPGLVE